MYSETIQTYSRMVWAEAYEAENRIKEELKDDPPKDKDTLEQCLRYVVCLREAMCNCAGWLESFNGLSDAEKFDKNAADWAKETLRSLCRFEHVLNDMYVGYMQDEEADGKVIDIEVSPDDHGIVIDIDMELPHKNRAGSKSSGMLSYLLDRSFEKQIGEAKDITRLDRGFIILEHHYNSDTKRNEIKDCDNYDTKHLIDLIACYFFKYGDGPDYVRTGEAVIPDDHSFTRVRVIRLEDIGAFYEEKKGYFGPF